MTKTFRAAAFLLLAAVAAVPASAAAISSDVTLPVGGYLVLPNELVYRTEITLTNHRDALQYVAMEMVADGHSALFRTFALQPRETMFLADGGMGTSQNPSTNVGAIRIRAILPFGEDDEEPVHDPQGQIEASAFVVAERGRFASRGSSRQEVAAVPSHEYTAEEAVFVGVRHDLPTYTNVGIVNMHGTQTETFFVQFQHLDPIAVVVPPLSTRQIRIPGPGNAGRSVRVYPEWAVSTASPVRTSPWVAYASTIDGYTGDAFSGTRVPVETTTKIIGQ